MLTYQINIPDLLKDGHPFQEFASSLAIAGERYEELIKLYPYNIVVLSEIKIITIKRHQDARPRLVVEKPSRCGRGHFGKNLNGQPIVREGSKGKYFCTVCDWTEEGGG